MPAAPDLVVVGLRALAFVLVIQAVGCAVFAGAFGTQLQNSGRFVLSRSSTIALLAIVVVVLQHFIEPARFAADFSGIFDSTFQLILLQSDAGAARAIRLLGLTIIATAAWSGRRHSALTIFGSVVALASFLLTGHTASDPDRWLLAPLLLLHLSIIAFWFGALLVFVWTAKREESRQYSMLVMDFSGLAVWLVPLLAVAGIVMAIVLLPDLAALTTAYGRLLILKILLFAVLLGLAAWNRYRLAPPLAGANGLALTRFRQIVIVEGVVIAATIAVTAVMTGLFGPD